LPKTTYFSALFILILIFVTAPATAKETVTVGLLDLNYSPYQKIEKNRAIGSDADIVREAFSRFQHYNFKYWLLPFKRAVKDIVSGEVDVSVGLVPSTYDEHVLFTDIPLHISEYKLTVLKGNEFDYRSMEDLVNKRLSLIQAPSINAKLDEYFAAGKLSIFRSKSAETQLKMLTLGRVDALVGNTEVTANTAKEMGLEDKIAFLPNSTLGLFAFHIIISKKSKITDLIGFHQKLREVLNEMEVDGTIENIYRKHNLSLSRFEITGTNDVDLAPVSDERMQSKFMQPIE
jgi:polar amino acid transport system substrate-binding protein